MILKGSNLNKPLNSVITYILCYVFLKNYKIPIMIQELENRAMVMELEYPNLINMDYSLFNNLDIPKEIELCDENEVVIINGKTFTTSPRAFHKNNHNSISDYLKKEVHKGHKVWIRRIITHDVGNEYTILESLSVNKLIL
jgi:hypothetical protein